MKPFITTAEAGDIAVTAAEGGVTYWAHIAPGDDPYDWSRWMDDDGDTFPDLPPDFLFYRLTDTVGEKHDVTLRGLKRGYRRLIASGYNLWEPDEPGAMDSGEADLVVQYAVFGKVVYG